MFVVLEYVVGSDNVWLKKEDGEVICFDTDQEANDYAEENCAWDFKIVEI